MRIGTLKTDTKQCVVGIETIFSPPQFVDLCAIDPEIPKSLKSILAIEDGMSRCRSAFEYGLQSGDFIEGMLVAPIPDPNKVICIGLNYRDHAIESKMAIPEEPVCFGKFGNTITGMNSPIRLPAVSSQVDYEAELVVIIGKQGYNIPQDKAFEYVAGYCNGNDVSARDWQIGKPGKQWLLGKTADTFAPIGPWLVTADEIPDPHQLKVELRLNGETMQSGKTSEFIFGIDAVIAYLSQIMTLEPGDVIFTGTPAGVGMGRNPQVWLKAGDRVEVEITGLDVLKNVVV